MIPSLYPTELMRQRTRDSTNPGKCCQRARRLAWRSVREPREAHADPCPGAAAAGGWPRDPVVDLDARAVLGSDLAHDRQAQAAAVARRTGHAVEALEDHL